MTTQPPLVARAQRLVTISVIAPFAVYLPVIPISAIRVPSNPYGPNGVLFGTIGFGVIFAFAGYFIHRSIYSVPTGWRSGGCLYGIVIAIHFLPMGFTFKDDLRFEHVSATYDVAVVAINIGVVLLGWLPGRRASHLVLGNLLSPDVVDSTLAVRFAARRGTFADLLVMRYSFKVEVWRSSSNRVKRIYPLTDVAGVSVRTETRAGTYPVPGEKDKEPVEVRTPGEVVVIELPEGQLVFPPERDAHLTKQFIEARMRRRASTAGDSIGA